MGPERMRYQQATRPTDGDPGRTCPTPQSDVRQGHRQRAPQRGKEVRAAGGLKAWKVGKGMRQGNPEWMVRETLNTQIEQIGHTLKTGIVAP